MKRYYRLLALATALALGIALYFGIFTPPTENAENSNKPRRPSSTSSTHQEKSPKDRAALLAQKSSSEKSLAEWKERFLEIQADRTMKDQDREMALREVMEKISSKTTISECLAFVRDTLGEGSFQDSLCLQIFSHSKSDTPTLLAAIAERENPKRRIHCYVGMIERMYLRQMADDEKILILAHAVEQKNLDAITLYTKWQIAARNESESLQEAMARIRALTDKLGTESHSAVSEGFAASIMSDDPFLAWEFKPKDAHTKEALFRYMMQNDKERTLALTLQDEALRDQFQLGLTYYLNANSTAANQWIDKHMESLDPRAKNQVLAAKYIHHLNHLGDNDHAKLNELRDLTKQISDLTIRKKVRDDIWIKEREMVRTTVSSEPQRAIEELVTGQSPYDAYWIEEAMDVWMEKDSEQAEQWYQENYKTLPKDKVQYAAASFAKKAIAAGDLDTASQWVSLIEDAKTKDRIEREINTVLEK